jgi:hypothetical protein
MSGHGVGASTSTRPASWSRATRAAVSSLLTLATTIGESDDVGAPSSVVPDERARTVRPSRVTVMLAGRPNVSNAAFVAGSAGSGSGSTVVVVVLVVLGLLVVVLLVVVLLVVVLLVVVVAIVVVVGIVVADGDEVDTSAIEVCSLHAVAIAISPARRHAWMARICTVSTVTGSSDSRGAGRRGCARPSTSDASPSWLASRHHELGVDRRSRDAASDRP